MNKRNQIKKSIVFSLVINIAFLVIALFLYKPFFEENDDAFISMIAEGAYGMREVHIIYPNILLGYIYKGLYMMCSTVRWHSVLQYVFLFMAFTILTYIIQMICITRTAGGEADGNAADRDAGKNGRMIASVVLLGMFYESYVSVQYSKTATIISAIGFIVLLYALRIRDTKADKADKPGAGSDKETLILEISAYILLVYGMLLRDSSFMLAALMMLPVGIFEFVSLIRRKMNDRKDDADKKSAATHEVGRFIALFAATGCLFLVFAVVNKAAYNSNAEWKEFMSYNDTRMQLLDYRYDLLDFNKYGSRLEEMDISANDALLYLTWQFGDDKILSTEKMQAVLDGAPVRKIDMELAKRLAQHLYEDVLVFNPAVIGTVLLVIYAFMILEKRKRYAGSAALISQLVIFAGILGYYEYSGRWSHRIVFAAMLVIPAAAVYLANCENSREPAAADKAPETDNTVNMGISIVVAIACATVLLGNRFDLNDYNRKEERYGAFFESIGEDKDTLYVADTFTFQEAYKFDVFKPYPVGSLENFVTVGSWFMNSPLTRAITGKYGYSNPFEALADGGAVLVDNMYSNEKLSFLNEHYGEHSFMRDSQSNGFVLYKVE